MNSVDVHLKNLLTVTSITQYVLGGYLRKYSNISYYDVFTTINNREYTRSGKVKKYFKVENFLLHNYRELALKLGCVKETAEPQSLRAILLNQNPMLCRIWAISPGMVAALALNQDALFTSYYEKVVLKDYKGNIDLKPHYTLGYLEQLLG